MSTYGFQEGHLKPNPIQSSEFFLGPRKIWAKSISHEIRLTIQSGRIPKVVIYGALGLGKTHLVTYLRKTLEDLAKTLYVECPPCHRRSKFHELHSRIMAKFGRIYFLDLIKKCITEFKDAHEIANSFNIDADIAYTITFGYEHDTNLLWRYLVGEKLRASDLTKINAVSSQIKEPEISMLLSFLAKLVKKYENKQLLIMIDEMEHTNPLVGDSMTIFRETSRSLVDENNDAGFVFISSVREDKDFRLVSDDAVRSRIGIQNYKKFEEYDADELSKLLKSLIQHTRTQSFPLTAKLKEAEKLTNEPIHADTYPFTETAIQNIVSFVEELRSTGTIESIRPREALHVIDRALAQSSEDNLKIIDKSIVEKIKKQFTENLEAEPLGF